MACYLISILLCPSCKSPSEPAFAITSPGAPADSSAGTLRRVTSSPAQEQCRFVGEVLGAVKTPGFSS